MNKLLSLPLTLLLTMLLSETANAAEQLQKQTEPLLQIPFERSGVLEIGDETLEAGGFYDVYSFEGQAGQIVKISLTSEDFDTNLALVDTDRELIASNDDSNGSTNSELAWQLPETSTYYLLVVSYDIDKQGVYQLKATTGSEQDAKKTQADQLYSEASNLKHISRWNEALEKFEQALMLYREIDDRAGEGTTLNNIGSTYNNLGQYPQALDYYEQALVISRDIGDRAGEGVTLNNIGTVYLNLGQYPRALDYYEQALVIRRDIGDRAGEGITLNDIGLTYHNLGQYPQALDYYDQALVISRDIGGRAGEGVILNNIGGTYRDLGQYLQSLDYYDQALVIRRNIGDRAGEGTILNNIGLTYHNLGQYPQALDYYDQALVISRDIGDRMGEGRTLNNIGAVYLNLGQYPQALDYYDQALVIGRDIGNRAGEGMTLNNIGLTYHNLGQYPQALDYYDQALVIGRDIGNLVGEGTTLNNIGGTYYNLDQYPQALDYYDQALVIRRDIGDRAGEGVTLNNIGTVYRDLGQYPQALDYYDQALVISRDIGDRAGEGRILKNIGRLLEATEEPELAIVFLKQSVNVYETIRKENLALSPEQQQSYTDTIADTYRKLADLLLQENRVLEAQAVLDLLKLQELDESLGDVQRAGLTQGVGYWEIEDDVLTLYTEILVAGQELARLQDPANQPLSDTEKARRTELQTRQQELRTSFNAWLDHPEVTALLAELQTSSDRQVVDLQNQYAQLQRELREMPQTSVILYPLILEERLELVLITPNAPPVRYPVAVTAAELQTAITEYGQILKSPHRPAQPLAQKLYSWLIEPIAADLEKIGTETIIYAPDGVLRYLPLAALHDGKNWLAQTYSTSQITSASLTSFGDRPSDQRQVLAAACAECAFSFDVAGSPFEFADLPATATEVSILADQIPETTILLNNEFSPKALQDELASYTILHLATHAAFVPERPKESFIVFGNEERVSLETIRTQWGLTNADLFVLSACETAVGNVELGTGIEILGMGFQLQNAGAKAALASLWQVSDGGTQILMNAFYAALNQGMTKAAALQAAQTAMITDNYPTTVGGKRATIAITNERGQPLTIPEDMSHPYYWAPFILIGNGL